MFILIPSSFHTNSLTISFLYPFSFIIPFLFSFLGPFSSSHFTQTCYLFFFLYYFIHHSFPFFFFISHKSATFFFSLSFFHHHSFLAPSFLNPFSSSFHTTSITFSFVYQFSFIISLQPLFLSVVICKFI